MTRTVDEITFPNVTLKGETGHAEVQMVTRLVDSVTGERVGSDTYDRYVIDPDVLDGSGTHPLEATRARGAKVDDDEPPEVRSARSGFVTQAMLDRWEAAKAEDET